MIREQLRRVRSALFLPPHNARAVAKARTLPCDLVILDLEDAVADADKPVAREAAIAAMRESFGERLVAIRINPEGGPHFSADLQAVRAASPPLVVVPKVSSAKVTHDVGLLMERPLLAMIESPAGVIAAPQIATTAHGLIAGTNDLSAALGIPQGAGRAGLHYSLGATVLAARLAGIPAWDGVYNGLDDLPGFEAEAREGRAFGFNGKSLIHPSQVEPANRIFGPSAAELADAEALIEAAAGGAQRLGDRMIEDLHVDSARALLARAGRATPSA